MIQEAYVSFETAKLLKEKGFNEPTLGNYYIDGRFEESCRVNWNEYFKTPINAPTQQMAMRWLREEFDLITYVKLVNDGDPCHDAWGFSIYNKFTNESIKGHRLWFKYEEAVEAAIKYCLENLI